ncbi:MAG TPA: MBL fold metallo-hydrolase [Solirubrobacterales bacterium]|nr:MBL fold metallo-hydrolase [Solirubrobacterales bacterium]
MFEIDFLSVGEESAHGDAIALRYTTPTGSEIRGIVDAGYRGDGDRLVAHVEQYYGSNQVDFVLLTHPDADHVNGMGEVMRGLSVTNLMLHRPAEHGFSGNSGSRPAEELVDLAEAQGTKVFEPFAGLPGFENTFLIAGPSLEFYRDQLAAQSVTTKAAAPSATERLAASLAFGEQAELPEFPIEVPFDDDGGTNPRNNSSAILQIRAGENRLLFTGDAGVPALNRAQDYFEGRGENDHFKLFQLPHHGSRHNLDSATCDRLLGQIGQASPGVAVVSVAPKDPKKPSPRITNACGRRGYRVWSTSDSSYWLRYGSPDAPDRPDAVPIDPIPPQAEPAEG